MSQNQNLQDYLNKNFPEKEENQQQNTTNFYPQTQSFLPQNYEFENSNQNLYNQNINNPNLSNPNLYNQNVYNQNVYNQNLYNQNINNPNINNPFQNQQSQSLMQKINSTASNVLDFFKSKTENISIPKNPLIKVDYSQNLLPLNQNGFEEEIKNNIIEINSIKIEKGQLNDMTIISLIQNPRVINDSYFKNKYVLYDIITQQFNWSVSRRYSDFIWLRETLQSIFPGEIIPVLPKKKIGNRRFDKDFIEKRSKGLQKFLDNVLLNEKFKTCENLLVFLNCADRNFFEQQMKLFNPNILKPTFVNQIRSFEGKVKLINFENLQNSKNYFNNLNNFLKSQNETLQIIHHNLNKFHMNLATACTNLDEVEKGFKKLNEISKKVNLSNNMCNVYEQYEIFFKNWKRLQINQTCVIKDVVNDFFKDIKGKCQTFSDLISLQENLKDDYINQSNKLNLKKESLWNQMDIKKWELNQMENIDMMLIYRDKNYAKEKMCFKETNDLKGIKSFIQYFYYCNYINYNILFKEFEKSYIDNLQEFTNQIQPNITDGVEVWSHLSSNIRVE